MRGITRLLAHSPGKAGEAWADLILDEAGAKAAGRFYRHRDPIGPPVAVQDTEAGRDLWDRSMRLLDLVPSDAA